ncbi:MAG: hypothetical protein Fur0020_00860 [Thermodesulfovibrionia bacterium]
MKRLFRFYFFSISIIIFSCAPRDLPPKLYSGIELTLNDVISRSSNRIKGIKAVLEIDIERADNTFYHTSASILIKEPRMVHIKTYNLGMLVGDVVVKGDDVYVLYGRIDKGLEPFIKRLYDIVFWWDGMRNGYMYKDNGLYIIHKDTRKLSLDSATLLPVKQSLTLEGKTFHINYDRPFREGDFWYPSFIEITMDDYRFLVKIERLFLNPESIEDDLMLPQASDQGILQQTQ